MLLRPLAHTLSAALLVVCVFACPALVGAQPVVTPMPGEPHIQPLDAADLAEFDAADREADAIDQAAEARRDADDSIDSDHPGAPGSMAATDDASAKSGPPPEPAAASDAPTPDAPAAMTEAEYAAALRDAVRSMRGRVEESLLARVEAKQASRMDRLAGVFAIVSFAGLLMLLAPLVLRRRYPHRDRVLWKYSAISAALFFLAVNLFGGVLLVMRGAQDVAGQVTNPQIAVVGATFDLLENKAADFADVGPILVEPTLAALLAETDKSVLSIMLENAGQLREDIGVFETVGAFVGHLDGLFGLLPLLLVLLVVVLFVQAARPTLTDIITLPARAAATYDPGLGKATLLSTLRSVVCELKATGCLLGLLIAISMLAGLCLGWVLQPAIEIFMAYLMVAILYVQNVEAASSFWIVFSLGSTILFLTLNLLVTVIATALYLSKGQRIFQQRFRDNIPLRAHRRFWLWGTGSLLLIVALPIVYILIADPVMSWLVVKTFSETSWALNLGLGPALFLVTFAGVFWAGRGVAAIGFLLRYKPRNETAGIGELDRLGAMGEPTDRLPPLAFGTSWQTAQSALAPRLASTPPEGQHPLPLPLSQYPTAGPALVSASYPSLPPQSPPPRAPTPWRTTPPPPPLHSSEVQTERIPERFAEDKTPTKPEKILSARASSSLPAIAGPPPVPPRPEPPELERLAVGARRAATVPPPIPSAARSRVARGTGQPRAIGEVSGPTSPRPGSTDPDLEPAGARARK